VYASLRAGSWKALQWLRAHGCPWGRVNDCIAAEQGHLETLKLAWAHHCPWDRTTCAAPLQAGTRRLQWAREHRGPES